VAIKSLSPLRSVSKSREVFQRLRDAIWTGELVPGMALRESHLAKQLSVSQVPVREALLQLEHLGLVVRVPDRGTTVTKLTRAQMVQMLDVRRHLEEYAFQLAAANIDDSVEAELREHLQRMKELVAAKDHFGVAEEDYKFHQTVWRASGNEALENTLTRLCVAVYAFLSMKRHSIGDAMQTAVKSHTKLLEALLTGKASEAKGAVRNHLEPEAALPSFIKD
jgi:DNA-binding GntR family transcriptional regulator